MSTLSRNNLDRKRMEAQRERATIAQNAIDLNVSIPRTASTGPALFRPAKEDEGNDQTTRRLESLLGTWSSVNWESGAPVSRKSQSKRSSAPPMQPGGSSTGQQSRADQRLSPSNPHPDSRSQSCHSGTAHHQRSEQRSDRNSEHNARGSSSLPRSAGASYSSKHAWHSSSQSRVPSSSQGSGSSHGKPSPLLSSGGQHSGGAAPSTKDTPTPEGEGQQQQPSGSDARHVVDHQDSVRKSRLDMFHAKVRGPSTPPCSPPPNHSTQCSPSPVWTPSTGRTPPPRHRTASPSCRTPLQGHSTPPVAQRTQPPHGTPSADSDVKGHVDTRPNLTLDIKREHKSGELDIIFKEMAVTTPLTALSETPVKCKKDPLFQFVSKSEIPVSTAYTAYSPVDNLRPALSPLCESYAFKSKKEETAPTAAVTETSISSDLEVSDDSDMEQVDDKAKDDKEKTQEVAATMVEVEAACSSSDDSSSSGSSSGSDSSSSDSEEENEGEEPEPKEEAATSKANPTPTEASAPRERKTKESWALGNFIFKTSPVSGAPSTSDPTSHDPSTSRGSSQEAVSTAPKVKSSPRKMADIGHCSSMPFIMHSDDSDALTRNCEKPSTSPETLSTPNSQTGSLDTLGRGTHVGKAGGRDSAGAGREGAGVGREGASVGREGVSVSRDGTSVGRDGASVNREGASVSRDGASVGRDGASVSRDGASVGRDGASVSRDGASVGREGASVSREGAGVGREGASVGRDGASVGRDGTSVSRDGASVGRDGANVSRDGASVGRDGANVSRDGASVGREGTSVGRNGASVGREGASVSREGASVSRDGVSVSRDGASVHRDGANVGREGASVSRDGASVRDSAGVGREGACVSRDGTSVGRDSAGVSREGSSVSRDTPCASASDGSSKVVCTAKPEQAKTGERVKSASSSSIAKDKECGEGLGSAHGSVDGVRSTNQPAKRRRTSSGSGAAVKAPKPSSAGSEGNSVAVTPEAKSASRNKRLSGDSTANQQSTAELAASQTTKKKTAVSSKAKARPRQNSKSAGKNASKNSSSSSAVEGGGESKKLSSAIPAAGSNAARDLSSLMNVSVPRLSPTLTSLRDGGEAPSKGGQAASKGVPVATLTCGKPSILVRLSTTCLSRLPRTPQSAAPAKKNSSPHAAKVTTPSDSLVKRESRQFESKKADKKTTGGGGGGSVRRKRNFGSAGLSLPPSSPPIKQAKTDSTTDTGSSSKKTKASSRSSSKSPLEINGLVQPEEVKIMKKAVEVKRVSEVNGSASSSSSPSSQKSAGPVKRKTTPKKGGPAPKKTKKAENVPQPADHKANKDRREGKGSSKEDLPFDSYKQPEISPKPVTTPTPAVAPSALPVDTSDGDDVLAAALIRLEAPNFYMMKAKEIKHMADKKSDKPSKLIPYIRSVLYFVMWGHVYEKQTSHPNETSPASHTIFQETLNLHNYVNHLRLTILSDFTLTDKERKLSVLILRIHSILYLKMFSFRKNEVSKCRKIIETDNKSTSMKMSAHAPSPHQNHWNKNSTGTPSPMSPTPSPACSIGSVESQGSYEQSGNKLLNGTSLTNGTVVNGTVSSPGTVAVPVRLHTITQKYLTNVSPLVQSYECWDTSNNEIRTYCLQEFFEALDRRCGVLTQHSSLPHLVTYANTAIRELSSPSTSTTITPPSS